MRRRRTRASCRSRASSSPGVRPAGLGVRVDHGLNPSQAITPYYDPMLAKIIATGASREEARRRLVQALEDTIAFGIATNRAFLIDALNHPEFVAGAATTQFIPKNFAKIAAPAADRCSCSASRPCSGSRRARNGMATIPRARGLQAARSAGRSSWKPAARRSRAR